MSNLSASQLMWLSDLADGQWHSNTQLASERNIPPRGRGAVSKLFGDMTRAGYAEWSVINDTSHFRISPAGLAAIQAEKP